MGTVIQFIPKKEPIVELWPNDWENEFNPTLRELRLTLDTIDSYRYMLLDELATSGVQSEFSIREGLEQLDCMRGVLLNYYIAD